MDIWYFPTITEYIKLLLKPVLYKLTPHEATKVLEEFEPNVRKFFLTKGIINLLPPGVRSVFIPGDKIEEPYRLSTTENPLIEQEIEALSTRSDLHGRINTTANEEQSLISLPFANQSKDNILIQEKYINKDESIKSNNILKDIYYEREFPLVNAENGHKLNSHEKTDQEDPYTANSTEVKKLFSNDDYQYYEIEDESGHLVIKTKVLESSNKVRTDELRNGNLRLTDLRKFCWDRLEEYNHKEAIKKQKGSKESEKVKF